MVRGVVNMRPGLANFHSITRIVGLPRINSENIPATLDYNSPEKRGNTGFVNQNTCEEIVNEKFNEILNCIDDLDFRMSGLITSIDGLLPIKESDINDIYVEFIAPFLACDFYRIGSMNEAVNIDKTIKCLIKSVTSAKTRLVLIILRDLLPGILNARNIFIDNIRLKKQVENIQEKYKKAKELIIILQNKVAELEGTSQSYLPGLIGGNLQLKTWTPPNFLYIQAKFNLEMAWYQYLYNTTKLDTDKYSAVESYIRSFKNRDSAYELLVKLLDERFKKLEEETRETSNY